MLKYSIIVPVYKAEGLLAECIDSVLNQKEFCFELILVDDGSPDNSGKICDEYAKKDSRIRVIHKSNGGVSSARNAGIDASRGKYIIFLDSDDFVDRSYFDVINGAIDSGADFVSFGMFDYVHKKNDSIEIEESSMNISASFDGTDIKAWGNFIVPSFFAAPWNKVFLSSVIKDNGLKFKEGVVCFEDYLFCLEYAKYAKSVNCVSTPIYYYRSYEAVNHVSKRKWGERFFISRLVYSETERFIQSKGAKGELNNLHRYTYQAYMTELKAAKMVDEKGIETTIKQVLHEEGFLHAIRVISPRGKFFPLLSMLIGLKLNGVATKMILKRI